MIGQTKRKKDKMISNSNEEKKIVSFDYTVCVRPKKKERIMKKKKNFCLSLKSWRVMKNFTNLSYT